MARVSDEWFRGPAWDGAARERFEERLSSSPPSARAQHLRLKALSLLAADRLDAARDLLQRALDEPGLDGAARAAVLEQLGRIAVLRGDRELARRHYRAALEDAPTTGTAGTTNTVELELAELLLDSGEEPALDEAAALLSAWIERSGLRRPAQLYRWNIALLRLAQADGDRETARDVARTALTLAAEAALIPRQRGADRLRPDPETLDVLKVLAR